MRDLKQKDRIEKGFTLAACSTVILMPFICVYYKHQQAKSAHENSKDVIDNAMFSSLLFGALLGTLYVICDTGKGFCTTVSNFFAAKLAASEKTQQTRPSVTI